MKRKNTYALFLFFILALRFGPMASMAAENDVRSPYVPAGTPPGAAIPAPVQAAMKLAGTWQLIHQSETNTVQLTHVTGLILRLTGAGMMSQRYLKQGNLLLRFKGRERIEIVWHLEDDELVVKDGDYAGARMIRQREDPES